MKLIIASLFVLFSVFQAPAQASVDPSTQPRRLIETAPGVQKWMVESEISALSEVQHEKGRCGGFMDVTDYPVAEPLAFGILSDFSQLNPTQQNTVDPLLLEVNPQNLVDWVKQLSSFSTRNYNTPEGEQSAKWIADQYRKISAGRTDVSVKLVPHKFKQPSVIARIEGVGPLSSEVIVVGGHQDSINHFGFLGRSAPGADDNASGTATVLEIFRVIVQSGFRPNRSLEFMAYAGEEVGLLGSQAIAEQYKKENKLVRAAMQFDMTMFPGAKGELQFVTDNVNPSLTVYTKKLVDTYVKVKWADMKCGYACSDHASWNRAGYPAVFPFEAPMNESNDYIHSSQDTIEKLDFTFGSHFAKLGVAYLVELAQAKF